MLIHYRAWNSEIAKNNNRTKFPPHRPCSENWVSCLLRVRGWGFPIFSLSLVNILFCWHVFLLLMLPTPSSPPSSAWLDLSKPRLWNSTIGPESVKSAIKEGCFISVWKQRGGICETLTVTGQEDLELINCAQFVCLFVWEFFYFSVWRNWRRRGSLVILWKREHCLLEGYYLYFCRSIGSGNSLPDISLHSHGAVCCFRQRHRAHIFCQ